MTFGDLPKLMLWLKLTHTFEATAEMYISTLTNFSFNSRIRFVLWKKTSPSIFLHGSHVFTYMDDKHIPCK